MLIATLGFGAELLSLKANMKQTSALLKQVTQSVNDSTKNAANADNAAKMIELFKTARNQTPGVGSFLEYQSLIDQCIAEFTNLQKAFQNNDNKEALSTIQKLNQIKKEGHDKFN